MPFVLNNTAIDASEIKTLIDSNTAFAVLDPLVPEQYNSVHVKGAINACVYEIAFSKEITEKIGDRQFKVLIYGNSPESLESEVAAQKMSALGYTDVRVVKGGIQTLIDCGMELEGSKNALDEAFSLLDGDYTYTGENSTVEWVGRNANGKHIGTVDVKSGALSVQHNTVQGKFEIDMQTIANQDVADENYRKMLVDHLWSDDFFSISTFPVAHYEITGGKCASDATLSSQNFHIQGKLTLCGIKKDLAFPATFSQREDGSLIFEAHFDLDRTLWNVAYGSSGFFRFLGMHMIYDPVSIGLRLELARDS